MNWGMIILKGNIYRDAMNHLEFSGDLLNRVLETRKPSVNPVKVMHRVLAAAAIAVLMVTTAFAASPELREEVKKLLNIGTSTQTMSDAQIMEFTESAETQKQENVSMHYLKLEPRTDYSFHNGMLFGEGTFYRVNSDYELEAVPTTTLSVQFEKDGFVYGKDFTFVDTGDQVISKSTEIFVKNEQGEIFLDIFEPGGGHWPVYLNVETGAVRDALPGFTSADFDKYIVYTWDFREDVLVYTIDPYGNQGACGVLYWVREGAMTRIELPYWDFTVENGEIYCQNDLGHLYQMDESYEFQLISDYPTQDDLTNGLLTVQVDGNLGIYDVYEDVNYIIDGLKVGQHELDETMGYNAKRVGTDGPIAVVRTELVHDDALDHPFVKISMIGILNEETGALQYLQIENDYEGYINHWLDENRFAVLYKDGVARYLCVYEFGE